MDIGISTACLYPTYTEDSLKKLVSLGFRKFEVFFNSPLEIEDEFIESLERIILKCGCKIYSIHPFSSGFEPFLLFSPYYRRFLDGIKYYKKFYKAASKLKAKCVILHGDRLNIKNGISEEEYFERYYKLFKISQEYGVLLSQENVNNFRSQEPEFINKMSAYLGNEVSYVLDIKQAVRAGRDPFKMFESMKRNLNNIHLNDHNALHDCLLPGKGNMDYEKFFNLLKINNYNGDLIIEVYRENFNDISELSESANVLRKYLN